MTTVQVTIEMTYGNLDDKAARELARQMIEARGLEVARVAVKAQAGRVKTWAPRRGKPGAPVAANGRRFQVWDEAPDGVWVVPEDRRPDDAPVYLFRHGTAYPYHSDGKVCQVTREMARREDGTADFAAPYIVKPCAHPSHGVESAA